MIDLRHKKIPLARQCDLLGLARSSMYYRPRRDDAYNAALRRLIDEQFMRRPFYGARRMSEYLKRRGHAVNVKRVRRLMRLMGIEAIYSKPRLSSPGADNRVYPYLLRGLKIERCDQVWAADITYIPMPRGFLYLVAIIDWASRYVIAWEVSNTLEAEFCVACLQAAMARGGPEIFNTDQGSQFTSGAFTGALEAAGVAISMDGRGRCYDNIFIERLWRSVKYEEIYLNDYEDGFAVRDALERYFDFYNYERPHQGLDYSTPAEIYFGGGRGAGYNLVSHGAEASLCPMTAGLVLGGPGDD